MSARHIRPRADRSEESADMRGITRRAFFAAGGATALSFFLPSLGRVGDGFAYALSVKIKRKPYRVVRVCSDVTMIVIAAVIGFVAIGTTGGVREGTVISALLVGTIAGIYFSRLKALTRVLVPFDQDGDAVKEGSGDGATAGNR